MATGSRRGSGGSTYVFKFVGTAALLVVGTLALVLYVLPERYVLSSGFREGSLTFPNPSTPFEPAEPLRIAAIPSIPTRPGFVPRGPSQIFWDQVMPILRAERYRDAVPLFALYLGDHPGDLDVRREYALTLINSGYPDRAIPILEELLAVEEDPALHLILARTLRDEGRVAEASEHYAILVAERPDDAALLLEWARSLMWIEDYEAAERVLLDGLGANPMSVALKVELARVFYYTDRLEEAEAILTAMTEAELRSADGLSLREDVVAALTPPPEPEVVVTPPPPPTLLEQALAAREADDFTRATTLFEAALADSPDDAEIWRAYADFLQYEMADFAAALEALHEVERLDQGGDAALQYRMAQLEIWTDRTDEARARLEALLSQIGPDRAGRNEVDAAEPGATPVARSDVLALLGDLDRWDGERLPAVARYEAALLEDPEHERALEGLASIRSDVHEQLVRTEQPGIGGIASSFADTDDFRRLDLGSAVTGLHRDWVWGTRSGARWLEGTDLAGASADRQGAFVELEGARWWRWGTVRTAAHFGVQTVRADAVDPSIGVSARLVGGNGHRTDVRFDHEPALGLTRTLQSVEADVRQDRLAISHSRPLSMFWSAAATGEVASVDHREVAAADRNLRLQAGASVGRAVTRSLTLGLTTRALLYRDAAPDAAGIPLYWDPNASVSVGPYAQLVRPLGTWWDFTASVNPGLSYIDERRGLGSELVPDLSARVGVAREGAKYRTLVEFFYGQGRFSGYRSFGVDASFTARGWFGPGGDS